MSEIAKKTTITIQVGLDKNALPTQIEWAASEMHPDGTTEPCKAFVLALFDKAHHDTLRIDLWTKEMQVQEMDRFMYQIIKSLGDTYLRATNNKNLAEDIARFGHYFGQQTKIIPTENA